MRTITVLLFALVAFAAYGEAKKHRGHRKSTAEAVASTGAVARGFFEEVMSVPEEAMHVPAEVMEGEARHVPAGFIDQALHMPEEFFGNEARNGGRPGRGSRPPKRPHRRSSTSGAGVETTGASQAPEESSTDDAAIEPRHHRGSRRTGGPRRGRRTGGPGRGRRTRRPTEEAQSPAAKFFKGKKSSTAAAQG